MGISLFLQIWINSDFFPLLIVQIHFSFSWSFPNLGSFQFVFLSWNIEIDRREWAHRGTWYSYMLLLLRAHFSFCQLPLLEITSNLALLCSNSHQTNPNSTPHTLIIMDFNSTTTSSSMPHNTTGSSFINSLYQTVKTAVVFCFFPLFLCFGFMIEGFCYILLMIQFYIICNQTESVTFDSVAERSPSSTVQVN